MKSNLIKLLSSLKNNEQKLNLLKQSKEIYSKIHKKGWNAKESDLKYVRMILINEEKPETEEEEDLVKRYNNCMNKSKDQLIIWDNSNEGIKETLQVLKQLNSQKEEIKSQLEQLKIMEVDVGVLHLKNEIAFSILQTRLNLLFFITVALILKYLIIYAFILLIIFF